MQILIITILSTSKRQKEHFYLQTLRCSSKSKPSKTGAHIKAASYRCAHVFITPVLILVAFDADRRFRLLDALNSSLHTLLNETNI